jgi:hypothetical protein
MELVIPEAHFPSVAQLSLELLAVKNREWRQAGCRGLPTPELAPACQYFVLIQFSNSQDRTHKQNFLRRPCARVWSLLIG